MKYTHLKTAALMLSASALLVLSGCDGTAGTASNSGIGQVPVVVPPPVDGNTPPPPVISDLVPDAVTSTVTSSPATVKADGIATSTVTVTVNDANSNPIADATVTLEQTGTSTISAVTNGGDGTYTFDVNSTTVEKVTYTATADGIVITQTADVDFIGLPANMTIDNAALQSIIASIFDNTPYNPAINIQGVINQKGQTVSVPYTVNAAAVTLKAYSTSVTLDASVTEDDEAGIVATFAWEEQNLSVGSGAFIATITIDDTNGNDDGVYKAKKLDIEDDIAGLVAATFPYATNSTGGTGMLTLKILPGIPDRMFGQADNNGNPTTHMFLYLPVTNPVTGKTWLNNDLGANYANSNNPAFNPAQQATASDDHNAYGSMFQWGRKADGHELIEWTNSTSGAPVYGTTSTLNDNPTDALFITTFDTDWRVTPDDTLWASETSVNNVCPVGYRVPTLAELEEERATWSSDNTAGAFASELKMSMPGLRNYWDGTNIIESGTRAIYWSSTVIITPYTSFLSIRSDFTYTDNTLRSYGFLVRCLKEDSFDPIILR